MYVRGKGVRYEKVATIIESVSRHMYGENIIVHQDARPIREDNGECWPMGNPFPEAVTGYGFQGRIIGQESGQPGTRKSWSGRRGPWACWHAYRDVMRAILTTYPHAVITTAHARYEGRAGFEDTYPGTANINVGSMAQPAYMPDLCGCDDDE